MYLDKFIVLFSVFYIPSYVTVDVKNCVVEDPNLFRKYSLTFVIKILKLFCLPTNYI